MKLNTLSIGDTIWYNRRRVFFDSTILKRHLDTMFKKFDGINLDRINQMSNTFPSHMVLTEKINTNILVEDTY